MDRRSSTRTLRSATTPNPAPTISAPTTRKRASSARKLSLKEKSPARPISRRKSLKTPRVVLKNITPVKESPGDKSQVDDDIDDEPLNILTRASYTSDVIYVSGPPTTGKTALVKRFLAKDPNQHVFIDCSCLVTPSHLYSLILKSLSNDEILSSHGAQNFVQNFLRLLKDMKVKKYYIVLDNIHRIKNTQLVDCIPLLVHIDEIQPPVEDQDVPLVQLVFITSESVNGFVNYFSNICFKDKLIKRCQVINMCNWSKKTLVDRISACAPNVRPDLYRKLVNNIVNTHYNAITKDYFELINICETAFERFISQSDEPLDDIDLRYLSRDKFLKVLGNSEAIDKIDHKMVLDMLVVITGAYIASFTRPKDDKANFVKSNAKSRRRRKMLEPSANFCHGARPFALERLLQIYRHLQDDGMHERLNNPNREDLLDSVLANVRILVDLKYLRQISEDGLSCLNKYVIADSVDYRYAKLVAHGIEVNLDDYLT